MPRIEFTRQLNRHLQCPAMDVEVSTLREALDQVFDVNPQLRGYVLDDQGSVRKHVAIFIDGQLLRQRDDLDFPVGADTRIYVMQALSGG